MSHEIENLDTPIYVGNPAWHRLGRVITVAEAANKTFHEFQVDAGQIADVEGYTPFVEVPTMVDGEIRIERVEFADFQGLVRRGPDGLLAMHVHTDSYAIAQDASLGHALDAINAASTGGPLVRPEAAVTLRNKRVTMLTGRFLTDIVLPGGDRLQPFVIAINSHDGSQSRKLRTGAFRPDCANMLRRLLATAGQIDISIRHTKGADAAMADAEKALVQMTTEVANFEDEARRMIEAALTDQAFEVIVRDAVKPAKDDESSRIKADANLAAIKGLWNDDPRVGDYKRTVWGAYQAISTWEQHLVPGRNVDERNALAFIGTGFPITAKASKALVAALA